MEICPSYDEPAHFEITEVFPDLGELRASVREISPDNEAIRLAAKRRGESQVESMCESSSRGGAIPCRLT